MRQEHASSSFRVAIVNGRPRIHGDCDAASAAAIDSLAAFDSELLEVDLSGVTCLDLSALRALLRVRSHNPNMTTINPSDCVLEALKAAGVIYVITSESVD
jgi:hypothetical protein